jgi:hypothetical protein
MWISYFEEKPYPNGWYATLYSWEPHEGVFDEALYWTGEWNQSLPVGFWWGPFDTEEEATQYGEENNWENK